MMSKIRICDIAEQVRGVSYKPCDIHSELNESSVMLLRANNISDGKINFDDVVYVDKSRVSQKQFLRRGDILVCASSGSKDLVGKAASIDFDTECTFGAFCKAVRPNAEYADYLGVYFQSNAYRRKIFDVAIGANINNIKNEHIDLLEIPTYDKIYTEQFIAQITNIQNVIDCRKKQLAKLDELVKARFVEMFGDPETNPKGFKKVLLSDIAEYFNGLTYSPDNVNSDGTIVLRSSNIQNSQLDFADTVRVDCSIKEKLYVKDNDILMCSRNGSARLVGKVALIKNITEPMSFGAFMMIIRSKYYSYLMTYFQMEAFRRQISTGATTTINQITGNMLNKITLPLPDMSEAKQFAAFVEQVDKSKIAVQKALDEAQILFDSLMQQYFG